jgi:predicted anti-sigma-YlaC factor YlaD
MTNKTATAAQAAARLLQALDTPDDLTCDEAQTLLPAFVEGERAGLDVDAAPDYAALLRHLDHCAECMELYTTLAQDLEALAGEEEPQPLPPLTPPSFFSPMRQSETVVVRILRGMTRRFELALAIPKLVPSVATLSGGQRTKLFSDTLTELDGAPVVSISMLAENGVADVMVAVREVTAPTRWQVQLINGDDVQTATTDTQGIARFGGLAVQSLQDVTVSCVEIRD